MHLLGEGRGDQVSAVGEPPKQGGHADTRTARDLVGGGIEPVLGEHLPSRNEHTLTVALRIRPQYRCHVPSVR